MKNKTLLFIFFIAVFLGLSSKAMAATYYVKNGGNDSASGLSDATAWATIAKVQSTVRSGDTVYFRSQDTWSSNTMPVLRATVSGVIYDGATYGNGSRAVFTTNIATASNSLVWIEADDVTFRGFDINGNAKRVGGIYVGAYALHDVSNAVIDNVKVHNTSGVHGTDWNYGILVSPHYGYTVYNTTITDSEIFDNFHEGIAVYASWNSYNNKNDGVLIKNCSIHDNGNAGVGSGTGVAINNNSANVTVENCDLYNNSKDAIDIRVSPPHQGGGDILAAPTNFIIRNNLIRNNWLSGIQLTNERSFAVTGSVYGNVFYNNGNVATFYKEGSDVNIVGGYYIWEDAVLEFYNNTFYNTAIPAENTTSRASFANRAAVIGNSATFVLKNNLFYVGDYPAVKDWPGSLTHSNNLIYRASGNAAAVEAIAGYSQAISPTTVTVTNDATYTYFTKADDATDWSRMFNQWDRIKWSGFSSPYLGNSLLVNSRPEKNRITVYTRVTPGYYENIVTGKINGNDAIPATKVGVWAQGSLSSTWFLRAANSPLDWRTIANIGDVVKWSGFSNPVYNGTDFTITKVSGNYFTVAAINNEFPETAVVTAQRAVRKSHLLSDISAWEPTAKNSDPLFINAASGDFRLRANSPAIDSGISVGLTSDYAGNPIIGTPDIGAYEYQSASQTPTYSLSDFLRLLSDWLRSIASPADVNNDGTINARDLGVMMHLWQ